MSSNADGARIELGGLLARQDEIVRDDLLTLQLRR